MYCETVPPYNASMCRRRRQRKTLGSTPVSGVCAGLKYKE